MDKAAKDLLERLSAQLKQLSSTPPDDDISGQEEAADFYSYAEQSQETSEELTSLRRDTELVESRANKISQETREKSLKEPLQKSGRARLR